MGLARAVSILELKFFGRHHSGLDDSKNIAQILSVCEPVRAALIERVPA